MKAGNLDLRAALCVQGIATRSESAAQTPRPYDDWRSNTGSVDSILAVRLRIEHARFHANLKRSPKHRSLLPASGCGRWPHRPRDRRDGLRLYPGGARE